MWLSDRWVPVCRVTWLPWYWLYIMSRVPNKRAKSDGGESSLSYTPQNTMDYGTLLCTASNTVGEQRKPCVFHIIMAGRQLSSLSDWCRQSSDWGLFYHPKRNICLSYFPINLIFSDLKLWKYQVCFLAWLGYISWLTSLRLKSL